MNAKMIFEFEVPAVICVDASCKSIIEQFRMIFNLKAYAVKRLESEDERLMCLFEQIGFKVALDQEDYW